MVNLKPKMSKIFSTSHGENQESHQSRQMKCCRVTITPLIQNVAMDYIRNYSLLQHWLLIRLDMSVSFDIAFYACKWWRPKKGPTYFFSLHSFFVLWDRRPDATCLVAMWEVQEQSLSTGYSMYAKLIGIWVQGKKAYITTHVSYVFIDIFLLL